MSLFHSRRTALKQLAAAGLVPFVSLEQIFAAPAEKLPPVRTITKGPKHHWFGYYDKLEFDPTNRYVLSNEVEFEHRTPNADDRIAVGMVDTQNNDEWIPLGKSDSWGWQQGCMLQWRPGSKSEVVWNDREGDQHVCRVKDIQTGATRTLPRPIYTLSPDGKWAITADFSRIQRMRPGYGYVGLEDPCRTERAPEESGVWRMDMTTGETQLIFSLADAAAIPFQGKSLQEKWNYFNHLLISPDSSRFIVLHRWRESTGEGTEAEPTGRFDTRMFTADIDGSNRYILDPSGYTSHFIWRDPEHICAWTKPEGKDSKFYLFKDQTDQVEVVAPDVMAVNGHNTYLPIANGDWILNDTYPQGSERLQTPYLYHVPTGRRFDLGHFHLPSKYKGEWRCDLHPRSSNDGKTIAIDSPHTGAGRQVHLIDVSEIVG
ncbi:hypothetical protein [Rubinisphaera italica]|uniref:Oligogalacturonide lyase n=1 Tax=Rubinisphaera italica TaxID=2527969 RepID=A0A5C5XK56_9PLAN|nr:hypothetical protein [Rubinisphaera italica]TWT62182.1 hypothetical protein Pan54_29230 [Rubinisphaera italica]